MALWWRCKILDVSEIVHRCSPWEGYTFDPGTYISAVNALHGEDQDSVIAGLRAYAHSIVKNMDLAKDITRVFFLLRLLFIPADPEVRFPPIRVGRLIDINNPPLQDFPLYPLVLIEDVPLLIVTGFMLSGLPEDPMNHIEFCERYCFLRTRPLCPPDNPLPLAESLMTSKTWHREEVEHDRGVLRSQLLRLVRDVYTLPGVDEPTYYSKIIPSDIWENCVCTYNRLHAVWDEEKNDYSF